MYSVVLLTALATSSAAPEFCHGGRGCYGGCYGGGHGYYGCCGGCYGCFGGGYGCYGCYGCWGGCYGGGCYGGCYGGGYGGYGCSCYGGYSGYGGWICSGATYTNWCGGCYGCYGGYSGYGMPLPGAGIAPGTVVPSTTPPMQPELAPPPMKDDVKKKPEEQTRAKVRVDVPEDARLYIDGKLMKTGSATRVFQTPPLAAGQVYFYDVRVELDRNGQTVTESQRMILRPGQNAAASFAGLEQRATGTATARQD